MVPLCWAQVLKAIAEDSGFGALLIPEGSEALKWVEWCLNESEGAFKLTKEGVEKLNKALEDRVGPAGLKVGVSHYLLPFRHSCSVVAISRSLTL